MVSFLCVSIDLCTTKQGWFFLLHLAADEKAFRTH